MPIGMLISGVIGAVAFSLIGQWIQGQQNLAWFPYLWNGTVGAVIFAMLTAFAENQRYERIDAFNPEWTDPDGNIWVRGSKYQSGSIETLVECGSCHRRLSFVGANGQWNPLAPFNDSTAGTIHCPGHNGIAHPVPWFTYAATFGQAQQIADAQIKALLRQERYQ